MKSSTFVTLLLWVFGMVIAAVGIVAIHEAQTTLTQTLVIVMIVLIVFMGVVSLVNSCVSKSTQDNYEVNKDAEKGKENTAFDKEESKRNGTEKAQQSQQQNGSATTQQTDTGVKNWESNYVPFGDYPKGNIVYVKEDGPYSGIDSLPRLT